ncbi:hypothetical protein HYG87_04660 [Methanobacterium alkalithermotolerans]|uniref:Uncharacterized protein n=1 Tax=Methanobacterium alkalithermotolerans TaxID=2731220 RepID=A0A8T8K5J3_9EURY|nr:hypothetical protein [Methanobacterium alkalithermotolerans]QUH23112.1 hypothetical protein HYG87_04660 [Methanobacterium alkalithermotolerans]RJS48390.1 MAG: hypothetical protein CIT03_08575 [Methanobacterium sp.]
MNQRNDFKKATFIIILIIFLSLSFSIAHQPRLASDSSSLENPIVVSNPEISQAFYGDLNGNPAYYKISSKEEFRLYVNLLVPDTPGSGEKLVSAEILDENQNILASLDGNNFDWEVFFEPFGGDSYLQGPEFNQTVPAGTYYIKVFNNENQGSYSLAIGDIETFPPDESLNAILLLPILKAGFFQVPVVEVFPQFLGIIIALGVFMVIYTLLIKSRKSDETLQVTLKVISSVNTLLRVGIIITAVIWIFSYSQNPRNILGGIATLLLLFIVILHWNLNSNFKSISPESLPLKKSTILMIFWWLFVFLRVVLI